MSLSEGDLRERLIDYIHYNEAVICGEWHLGVEPWQDCTDDHDRGRSLLAALSQAHIVSEQ